MVYAVLLAAVFAGAFTQAVAGFGSGMVAMAFVPLVMDVPDAVAVIAVVCLVVNYSIAVQMRRHVTLPNAGPMMAGALAGVPLGLLLLKRFEPSTLKLILGLVLVGYAIQALSRPKDRDVDIGTAWGFPFGFAGGALGGAFNTGGPPAVVYVTLRAWDKDVVKATLAAFFCAISTTQMPVYVAADVLRAEHLPYAAAALPTLGAGLWVGTRVYDRIDPHLFKRLVLVLIAVMGVTYVLRETVFA